MKTNEADSQLKKFTKKVDPFILESLESMRRKLLDLTGRNRLLNFPIKQKGSSLPIVGASPDNLYQMLLSENEVQFIAVPNPQKKQLIDNGYLSIDDSGKEERLKPEPTALEWAKILGIDTDYNLSNNPNPQSDSKKDNHLQCLFFPAEMEARLNGIRSKAQTAIEETGAGILYLALGFLEWFESTDSDKVRLAPLFTIPVMLERGKLDSASGAYKYQIKYTGEDIIPNLSLRMKLDNDFGILLPELEEGMLPEQYFIQVEIAIKKSKPNWKLKRLAGLSLLNFGKMLMYLDLDPARWPLDKRNIMLHPVVKRFFTSEESDNSDSEGITFEHNIDEIKDIHQQFPLIDDADSSQHSALIDAINGNNLVIEGPPGTGKSQTITNLIAAAMLSGKTVLFVAEKMAALEVVKHRLDKAGLGDFCLELHSHKSQKRKVLDEIQTRVLNQARHTVPQKIDAEVTRFEELKVQLNEYAKEINELWGSTGISIHDIFSGASRYRNKVSIDASRLHIKNLSGRNLDDVGILRLRDQVKAFSGIYREVRKQVGDSAEIYNHPWSGVTNTEIQIFDSDSIVDLLKLWQKSLNILSDKHIEFNSVFKVNNDSKLSLKYLNELNTNLINLPLLKNEIIFESINKLNSKDIRSVESYLVNYSLIQNLYFNLKESISNKRLIDICFSESLPTFPNFIKDFGSPKDYLVNSVYNSIAELNKLSVKVDGFLSVVNELNTVLPKPLSETLKDSKQGYTNLSEIIAITTEIPANIMRLRSSVFDDDGLDSLLPELKRLIIAITPLHKELKDYFRLDNIYSHNELVTICKNISKKGIFKWLDSEWRSARKALLNMATNPNVKFSTLSNKISILVSYSEYKDVLEKGKFKKTLGSEYSGIDTEINSLLLLRSWYKKVRSTYGVGFGSKVPVGDCLLNLDADLIKGLQQLNKEGLDLEIKSLISDFDKVLEVYPYLSKKLDSNKALSGSTGLIAEFSEKLSTALEIAQSWLTKDDITIEQFNSITADLNNLLKLQQDIQTNSIIKKVFGNEFQIDLSLHADNKKAITATEKTLHFVRELDKKLTISSLISCIRVMPSKDEYNELQIKAEEFHQFWLKQDSDYCDFVRNTNLDKKLWFQSTNGSVTEIIDRNTIAIANPRWLNGWINFIRSYKEMEASGLDKIWTEVMGGGITIDEIDNGLSLAIFDQLSREIISEKPHLARVSGINKQQEQNAFRNYDRELQVLQRKRVANLVAKNTVPTGISGGRKSEYTEMSLIKNELGKKTRHIPIRQLINRAGNALQALKPCFMMGPMSAAHYLQPGQIHFDLVVMDEASQVKPEDALGVIARGSQLVVVGDPKQLPPTSFFDRSDMIDDDDDVAAVIQTDSILDAALPLFPMRRLRWHYRSQHEHLIAYSNRNFYDSDLVVFPSPHAQSAEFGIKFTYVKDGHFTDQHNIVEAMVIAEAVALHAKNNPHESLGVVAMNSKQREQIERTIDELCKIRPEVIDDIDRLRNIDDGLFIKNLENVQGDERDVIFISFTYGPSEIGGRVYQRFGPINSDVGWRRLNVLYTRSKKRMHVFTSMKAEDILESESTKAGVKALRGFLHFAEKGNMDGLGKVIGKAPDSHFEVGVIEALYAAGFSCEPQVGVAGFFIDIAVKDPGNPGRYLMGIECDGATYHSAKSARDRDRLRQEVLERLGWRIRRIWSTDWFSNPQGELDQIIRELNKLKTATTENEPLELEAYELLEENKISYGVNKEDNPLKADEDQVPDLLTSSSQEIDAFKNITEGLFDNEASYSGATKDSLRESLANFSKSVIEPVFPNTALNNRLLRPAMIEALVELLPTTQTEFLSLIPQYLRGSTEPQEARQFLDRILSIIEDN